MKSITTLKQIYYQDHLSQLKTEGLDTEGIAKAQKRCLKVAETRAFIDTVIDEEHRRLSIFDFTGETRSHKQALSSQEALRAKNQVCKYIWGYSWQEFKDKFKTEDKVRGHISCNSVLMRRWENGNNVAIYGGTNGPCGRTMIASLIMKEAIRMRMFVPNIVSHTYDWVDYQTLVDSLYDSDLAVPAYRTADWLVVDNIYFKGESQAQIALRSNLTDSFFMYRLKNNLPTILVFQYDIRDMKTPLFKVFGAGVSNIVNNPRVCRIPLNKRAERN